MTCYFKNIRCLFVVKNKAIFVYTHEGLCMEIYFFGVFIKNKEHDTRQLAEADAIIRLISNIAGGRWYIYIIRCPSDTNLYTQSIVNGDPLVTNVNW